MQKFPITESNETVSGENNIGKEEMGDPSSIGETRPEKNKTFLSSWTDYGGGGELQYNQALCALGILMVKQTEIDEPPITENTFVLGTRKLVVSDKNEGDEPFKKTRELLERFFPLGGKENIKIHTQVAANDRRYGECFFPVTLPSQKKVYLYPSLSSSEKNFDISSSGIHQFVIAVCMFGSAFQAADKKSQTFPIIKHDTLYDGQVIHSVTYNPKMRNPYETSTFNDLQKQAELILKIASCSSEKEGKPQLLCHLPFYDYMLFGLSLYLQGKLTYKALESFFYIVNNKKVELCEKIDVLFKRNHINVAIQSPFENLFGALFHSFKTTNDINIKEIFPNSTM